MPIENFPEKVDVIRAFRLWQGKKCSELVWLPDAPSRVEIFFNGMTYYFSLSAVEMEALLAEFPGTHSVLLLLSPQENSPD